MARGERSLRRLGKAAAIGGAVLAALIAPGGALAHDKSSVPAYAHLVKLRPVELAVGSGGGARSVNAPGGVGAPNLYPLLPDGCLDPDCNQQLTGRPAVFVDAWTKPGKVLYRFDTVIGNSGGALDLYRCEFPCPEGGLVYQQIYDVQQPYGTPIPAPSAGAPPTGGTRHVLPSQMAYSGLAGHWHWHFQEAARYELLLPEGGSRVTDKVGFCMYDTYPPGAVGHYSVGNWCQQLQPEATIVRMGITGGLGDFYHAGLADQWIDVTGLPAGTYQLRAVVNPNGDILETNEADNALTVPRVLPGPTAASQALATAPGAALPITLTGTLVGPQFAAYQPTLSPGCYVGNPACYDDALELNGNPKPIAFAITDQPDHGTLAALVTASGTSVSTTYTPAPGFAGPDSFTFTTTDARGLVSQVATVTIMVGVPPTAGTAPSIAGDAREGATLTAAPGTWTGTEPIALGYQWERCDAAGAACAAVAGATAASYPLAAGDVGLRVRVVVTATGAAGTAAAASAPSAVVAKAVTAPAGGGGSEGKPGEGPGRRLAIRGTPKADDLVGTSAAEDIFGKSGPDTILGLGGADRIWGGRGNDLIVGGPGADSLFGGGGNDILRARDGTEDTLTCGSGRDVAVVDRRDTADRSCETVRRR